MITLHDLRKKYHRLIAPLDMELLFSFVLKKTREFVLAHPEYAIFKNQELRIRNYAERRIKHEPMAYILGKKEFYGLDFKVNNNTLIPRPETELLVDLALEEVRILLRNKLRNINIIDIGTGSGNIIISLAKQWTSNVPNRHSMSLFGIDISKKALLAAEQNAKAHKLGNKIKFLHGNLLGPVIGNWKLEIGNSRTIVLANLPYLSSRIYASAPKDVKLYEPKTALYSPRKGLNHYINLLKQAKKLPPASLFLEISPEQKSFLQKIIKQILPSTKSTFHKDLAGKWRVCKIKL